MIGNQPTRSRIFLREARARKSRSRSDPRTRFARRPRSRKFRAARSRADSRRVRACVRACEQTNERAGAVYSQTPCLISCTTRRAPGRERRTGPDGTARHARRERCSGEAREEGKLQRGPPPTIGQSNSGRSSVRPSVRPSVLRPSDPLIR